MCDISKTTDLKEAVIYKLCVPLGRDDIQSYFAKTVIKVGPVSGWIYGKSYDPKGLIYSPHMVDRTAGFVDLEDAVKLRKEQLYLLGFHSSVIVELHVVDMPDLPIMQGTGANIIMDSGLDGAVVLAAPCVSRFRILAHYEIDSILARARHNQNNNKPCVT